MGWTIYEKRRDARQMKILGANNSLEYMKILVGKMKLDGLITDVPE